MSRRKKNNTEMDVSSYLMHLTTLQRLLLFLQKFSIFSPGFLRLPIPIAYGTWQYKYITTFLASVLAIIY